MAQEQYPWFRKNLRCWYVWHNGEQRRLCADKDEAFRLWHRLEAGLEDTKPTGPTVAAVIDAYLIDAALRLKDTTMASKKKILLRLRGAKGEDAATTINAAVVLGWLNGQKWGQSRRWLACCVIKTCYKWAVGAKMLADSPVADLKVKTPRSRGVEAIVSPDTHEALLRAAPTAIRQALLALHATGCRPGEVCRVEARDFDAVKGVWRLDEHKTDRTGKTRIIYLTPPLTALCQELAQLHPTGTLFRNTKGNPLTPDRLRNWVFKTRRRLGLEGVIPYGYRHGFATDALSRGVADVLVAELLGHSTATLHRHYSHLSSKGQALRDAADRVRE